MEPRYKIGTRYLMLIVLLSLLLSIFAGTVFGIEGDYSGGSESGGVSYKGTSSTLASSVRGTGGVEYSIFGYRFTWVDSETGERMDQYQSIDIFGEINSKTGYPKSLKNSETGGGNIDDAMSGRFCLPWSCYSSANSAHYNRNHSNSAIASNTSQRYRLKHSAVEYNQMLYDGTIATITASSNANDVVPTTFSILNSYTVSNNTMALKSGAREYFSNFGTYQIDLTGVTTPTEMNTWLNKNCLKVWSLIKNGNLTSVEEPQGGTILVEPLYGFKIPKPSYDGTFYTCAMTATEWAVLASIVRGSLTTNGWNSCSADNSDYVYMLGAGAYASGEFARHFLCSPSTDLSEYIKFIADAQSTTYITPENGVEYKQLARANTDYLVGQGVASSLGESYGICIQSKYIITRAYGMNAWTLDNDNMYTDIAVDSVKAYDSSGTEVTPVLGQTYTINVTVKNNKENMIDGFAVWLSSSMSGTQSPTQQTRPKTKLDSGETYTFTFKNVQANSFIGAYASVYNHKTEAFEGYSYNFATGAATVPSNSAAYEKTVTTKGTTYLYGNNYKKITVDEPGILKLKKYQDSTSNIAVGAKYTLYKNSGATTAVTTNVYTRTIGAGTYTIYNADGTNNGTITLSEKTNAYVVKCKYIDDSNTGSTDAKNCLLYKVYLDPYTASSGGFGAVWITSKLSALSWEEQSATATTNSKGSAIIVGIPYDGTANETYYLKEDGYTTSGVLSSTDDFLPKLRRDNEAHAVVNLTASPNVFEMVTDRSSAITTFGAELTDYSRDLALTKIYSAASGTVVSDNSLTNGQTAVIYYEVKNNGKKTQAFALRTQNISTATGLSNAISNGEVYVYKYINSAGTTKTYSKDAAAYQVKWSEDSSGSDLNVFYIEPGATMWIRTQSSTGGSINIGEYVAGSLQIVNNANTADVTGETWKKVTNGTDTVGSGDTYNYSFTTKANTYSSGVCETNYTNNQLYYKTKVTSVSSTISLEHNGTSYVDASHYLYGEKAKVTATITVTNRVGSTTYQWYSSTDGSTWTALGSAGTNSSDSFTVSYADSEKLTVPKYYKITATNNGKTTSSQILADGKNLSVSNVKFYKDGEEVTSVAIGTTVTVKYDITNQGLTSATAQRFTVNTTSGSLGTVTLAPNETKTVEAGTYKCSTAGTITGTCTSYLSGETNAITESTTAEATIADNQASNTLEVIPGTVVDVTISVAHGNADYLNASHYLYEDVPVLTGKISVTNPVGNTSYKWEYSEDNGTTWTQLGNVLSTSSASATVTYTDTALTSALRKYRITATNNGSSDSADTSIAGRNLKVTEVYFENDAGQRITSVQANTSFNVKYVIQDTGLNSETANVYNANTTTKSGTTSVTGKNNTVTVSGGSLKYSSAGTYTVTCRTYLSDESASTSSSATKEATLSDNTLSASITVSTETKISSSISIAHVESSYISANHFLYGEHAKVTGTITVTAPVGATSYQWASSTDGTNWTNLTGSGASGTNSNASFSVTYSDSTALTVPKYYKITATNNGKTTTSTILATGKNIKVTDVKFYKGSTEVTNAKVGETVTVKYTIQNQGLTSATIQYYNANATSYAGTVTLAPNASTTVSAGTYTGTATTTYTATCKSYLSGENSSTTNSTTAEATLNDNTASNSISFLNTSITATVAAETREVYFGEDPVINGTVTVTDRGSNSVTYQWYYTKLSTVAGSAIPDASSVTWSVCTGEGASGAKAQDSFTVSFTDSYITEPRMYKLVAECNGESASDTDYVSSDDIAVVDIQRYGSSATGDNAAVEGEETELHIIFENRGLYTECFLPYTTGGSFYLGKQALLDQGLANGIVTVSGYTAASGTTAIFTTDTCVAIRNSANSYHGFYLQPGARLDISITQEINTQGYVAANARIMSDENGYSSHADDNYQRHIDTQTVEGVDSVQLTDGTWLGNIKGTGADSTPSPANKYYGDFETNYSNNWMFYYTTDEAKTKVEAELNGTRNILYGENTTLIGNPIVTSPKGDTTIVWENITTGETNPYTLTKSELAEQYYTITGITRPNQVSFTVTNNGLTATKTTWVGAYDVALDSVILGSSSIQVGNSTTVSYKIRNQSVSTLNVDVYSPNSSTKYTTVSIAAGETKTVSAGTYTATSEGTFSIQGAVYLAAHEGTPWYSIGVSHSAESYGTTGEEITNGCEKNYTNNKNATSITVTPATTVTAAISGDKDVLYGGNSTLYGTGTVTNPVGTTTYTWQYYNTSTSAWTTLSSGNSSSATAVSQTYSVTNLKAETKYRFIVTNNGKSANADITIGAHDVALTAVTFVPSSVNKGSTMRVQYTIKNNGVFAESISIYPVEASSADGYTVSSKLGTISSLAAGSSTTVYLDAYKSGYTVTGRTVGTNTTTGYIYRSAESYGATSGTELNYDNNHTSGTFVVHDTTITASISGNTKVLYGGSTTLTGTIKVNDPVGNTTYSWQYYDTSTSAWTTINTATKAESVLSFNDTYSVTNLQKQTKYRITATNNGKTAYADITVGARDVQLSSVTLSPTDVALGKTVEVTYTIVNNGTVTETINYYPVSLSTADGYTLSTALGSVSLAPGASVTKKLTNNGSAYTVTARTAGTNTAVGKIYISDETYGATSGNEVDYNNNVNQGTFKVYDTSITASVDGDTEVLYGGETDLIGTATVTNPLGSTTYKWQYYDTSSSTWKDISGSSGTASDPKNVSNTYHVSNLTAKTKYRFIAYNSNKSAYADITVGARDVKIDSITFSPSSSPIDKTMSVTYKVTNRGVVSETINLYPVAASDEDGIDITTAVCSITLAPGASTSKLLAYSDKAYTVTARNLGSNTTTGYVYLSGEAYCASSGNEVDYNNNQTTGTFTVYQSTVTAAVTSDNTTPLYGESTVLKGTGKVTNPIGDTTYKWQYYDTSSSTWKDISGASGTSSDAANVSNNYTVTNIQKQTKYRFVVINYGSTANADITIGGRDVKLSQITFSPTDVALGDSVEVTYTIVNNGTVSETINYYPVSLSTADGYTLSTALGNVTLDPGASVTKILTDNGSSYKVTARTVGSNTATGKIYVYGESYETTSGVEKDYTNNVAQGTFTVHETSITASVTGTTKVLYGESTDLVGTADVTYPYGNTTYKWQYYDESTSTWIDIAGSSGTSSSASHVENTYHVDSLTELTKYRFVAMNNGKSATADITVGARDVKINSITLTPASPTINGTFSVTYSITNRGVVTETINLYPVEASSNDGIDVTQAVCSVTLVPGASTSKLLAYSDKAYTVTARTVGSNTTKGYIYLSGESYKATSGNETLYTNNYTTATYTVLDTAITASVSGNTTVLYGESTTLTGKATVTNPIGSTTYKWQYYDTSSSTWKDISGTSGTSSDASNVSNTYTVSSLKAKTQYRFVAMNNGKTATADITVGARDVKINSITFTPTSQTINGTLSVTYSITNRGVVSETINLYPVDASSKDGIDVTQAVCSITLDPGATTSKLLAYSSKAYTVTARTLGSNTTTGYIYLSGESYKATSGNETLYTNNYTTASFTVVDTTITASVSGNTKVLYGESTTLTGTATVTNPLGSTTYKWQYYDTSTSTWKDISGTSGTSSDAANVSNTYTVSNLQKETKYRFVVMNNGKTANADITVGARDVKLNSVTFNPSNSPLNKTMSVTYNITNRGVVTETVNLYPVEASTADGIDITKAVCSVTLAPGETVSMLLAFSDKAYTVTARNLGSNTTTGYIYLKDEAYKTSTGNETDYTNNKASATYSSYLPVVKTTVTSDNTKPLYGESTVLKGTATVTNPVGDSTYKWQYYDEDTSSWVDIAGASGTASDAANVSNNYTVTNIQKQTKYRFVVENYGVSASADITIGGRDIGIANLHLDKESADSISIYDKDVKVCADITNNGTVTETVEIREVGTSKSAGDVIKTAVLEPGESLDSTAVGTITITTTGTHTIYDYVSIQGDTDKDIETTYSNNWDDTPVKVEDVDTLSLEIVDPKTDYREKTEVITSFRIIGDEAKSNVIPDKGIDVQLTVKDANGNQVYQGTTDAFVPSGEQNLVWIKWTVPEGLAEKSGVKSLTLEAKFISDTVPIDNWKGTHSDTLAMTAQEYLESVTDDTIYEDDMPSGFKLKAFNKTEGQTGGTSENDAQSTWSYWTYTDGAWKKVTQTLNLSVTSKIAPESYATSSTYDSTKDEWTMKSGYGVTLDTKVTVGDGSTVELNETDDSTTTFQYGAIYVPECRYSTEDGEFRSLDMTNSALGTICFKQNEDYGKIHFTPLWFPDTTYGCYVDIDDLWTPAGKITIRTTPYVIIKDNMYSDWYID